MIALRRIGEVNPSAIRRAAARAWPKLSHGEGRVPDYVVAEMHAEYLRCGSLRVAGAQFNRTKQDLAYVFKRRGLPLKSRGGPNRRKA